MLDKTVWLVSGSDFSSEKVGWFRIVLSGDDYYLNEGLNESLKPSTEVLPTTNNK